MKGFKKSEVAAAIIACLLSMIVFAGCQPEPQRYEGKEIVKITYSTVDYFGGRTEDYLLDFTSDTASKRSYMPTFDDGVPEYQRFADFTDSAATVFFDKCYTYGLFSLEKSYVTQDAVCDGGGWSLTIEYIDGTTFTSTGDNAGPYDVFSECKYAFYELCGEGVVGLIPSEYLFPPDISLEFEWRIGIDIWSDNSLAGIRRGNYIWNGHSVSDTSYYEVNRELSESNKFDGTRQYTLVLYTANYHYGAKFKKITLTCYDFNEEMSGGQVIFSSKWFRQEEFPLQFDKIYVYKMYWANGDFAEYTFNTKIDG